MNNKDIISLDNLKEMSGGDNKFIIEMIDIFLYQSDEMINDLENAVNEKDFELVKKKAHKFKSSALLFRINKLLEILIKIEKDGMLKESIEDRKKTLKRINSIMLKTCIQLRIEREKYNK